MADMVITSTKIRSSGLYSCLQLDPFGVGQGRSGETSPHLTRMWTQSSWFVVKRPGWPFKYYKSTRPVGEFFQHCQDVFVDFNGKT